MDDQEGGGPTPTSQIEKLIEDMKEREGERVEREKEILKDINTGISTKRLILKSESIINYLAKFVSKMLKLEIGEFENKNEFLVSRFPSYMHLVQVMEEPTEPERETFGKVKLTDLKPSTDFRDWIVKGNAPSTPSN